MNEGAAPITAIPRRGRSIVARLAFGLAVLSLLLAGFVALVVWAAIASVAEMRRAEQSFRQLETARNIEAAFNRYLLAEVTRRLSDGAAAESREAAAVRAAVLGYRRMIGSEIAASGDAAERAAERGELIRASALAAYFDAIETEALLERGMGADPAARARTFVRQIAGDRDRAFRAILYEIGQDERQEIAAASTRLREIRGWSIWTGAALGGAFLVAALYFGFSFRSGLQHPIRGLAGAAASFGRGDGTVRAPVGLPGEFSLLAERFNRMADDLSARQAALEDEVAARTSDLATANEELRRIDAARRRFFANVSHELRTPVTVLLGEAQLARRMGDDPAAMAVALARIDASGGFLRRRLDDLMRLARSEDGSLALTMADTVFPDPVAQAIDLARGFAQANEVRIEADLAAAAAAEITADADALRQAALALIDNAVKFSPPDGTVTVTAGVDTARVWFTVADQGPGFEGSVEAVLDRYAQEGQGRAAGGTGLGLAIAQWIAGQHGGTLSAANRADGGAEVTMEIPR